MISQTGLEVRLTLDDQLTASFNKTFSDVKKNVEESVKSVNRLGQSMNQAGRNMIFLGTAITGPLAIAFKTASNYSVEAGNSLQRLSTVAIDFQKTIGMAMIPVIDRLSSILQQLNIWFKSLDPSMRNMIIQGALVAGIFLILAGTLEVTVGKIFKLVASIITFAIANPILLGISLAIVLMISNWEKVKIYVLPVIEAMERIVLGLAAAYQFGIIAISKFLNLVTGGIWKNYYTEQIEGASKAIEGLGQKLEAVGKGEGFSGAIDKALTALQRLGDLGSIGLNLPDFSATLNQWSQSFQQTFKQAYDNAVNIGAQSANILVSQINMFSQRFGQAFSDMLMKGKNFGESLKAVFADMVAALVAAVVQMLVQWALYQAFQGVILGGAAAMGSAVAAAWAPAAAMVSLATFGANAGPAAGAIAGITALAQGLASIPRAEKGADIIGGGSVLVGERGPEILNLPAGARVSPLGKSSSGVTVYIENASFATEDEAEDTLQRLSRLIDEKSRSRIR